MVELKFLSRTTYSTTSTKILKQFTYAFGIALLVILFLIVVEKLFLDRGIGVWHTPSISSLAN